MVQKFTRDIEVNPDGSAKLVAFVVSTTLPIENHRMLLALRTARDPDHMAAIQARTAKPDQLQISLTIDQAKYLLGQLETTLRYMETTPDPSAKH